VDVDIQEHANLAASTADFGLAATNEAWLEIEPPAARRLLVGAAQAFAERGFHAATTRDIAERAGMSPGGLYVHFRSKEELLFQISLIGHRRALAVILAAAGSASEPEPRLRAMVRDFATWHAVNHTTTRVIQYEHAALTAPHLEEITELRRRIDRVMREAIRSGVETGDFHAPDVPGAALALLSLAIDVARWYTGPNRHRDPQSIGELYADLAIRMLR
jgi:AcrR family transcriptional regulator